MGTNTYIFVAYVYDINPILARPMSTKTDAAMTAAFQSIFNVFAMQKINITLNVMDNKCLPTVTAFIHKNNINI